MPRGPRQPSPQSNRTDQLSPAPVTTVPGQEYGQAAAQQAAQRAIPTANGPTMPAAQAPPTGGPPGPPQGGAPDPSDLMAQAMAHNGPAGAMALNRPTERPDEPVTHGLPVGPGAGPQALTGVGAAAREGSLEQSTVQNLLQGLASQPGATSAIKDLASRAASGVV